MGPIRPLTLGGRIAIMVALGLAVILLLFSLVALWTVRDSTEAGYRDRVTLAQALARNADDELRYALVTLAGQTAELKIDPRTSLTDAQRRQLTNLGLRIGSVIGIFLTDNRGNIVWSNPAPISVVESNLERFPSAQLALLSGEPQVSQTLPSGNDKPASASLSVPIRDVDGGILGTLTAELNPARSGPGALLSGGRADSMHVELVSSDGPPAVSGANSPGITSEHWTLLEDLMSTRTAGYRIHEPRSSMGFSGHIVAYAPLSLLPSWGIVLEQPTDVVVPHELAQRLGMIGVAILLLTTIVGWFEVQRVVKSLKTLTASAERFAAGHLDEPVELERADELGLLARAFETMRQQLRSSLHQASEWNRELERQVNIRTAEVEMRNRDLTHLNEIAELVSSSLDVKPLLRRTLEHLIEINQAAVGCLWMTEDDGSTLSLVADYGFGTERRVEHCLEQDCLCQQAMHSGELVAADRTNVRYYSATCPASTVKHCVAVPLSASEQVQGVLFLGSHQPSHLTQTEPGILLALGRQMGMAIANARLYRSLQTREKERAELLQRVITGQEEERQRLARELHDETSQALASLQFGLEQLATGDHDSRTARLLANRLHGITLQTLAAIHRLAAELRPSLLDDIGLIPAIERYLQNSAERWGLAIDVAVLGIEKLKLSPSVETAIYRIVQEALTNVAQHAHARNVSVLLERRADNLVVVIEDDGRGFDLSAAKAAPLEARLGLAGIEERALLINATLTIETMPGAGTAIFLEVPLDSVYRVEESHVEVASIIG